VHGPWRGAVAAFLGLILVLIVAVTLVLVLREAVTPLPYNDPEPPVSS
jgi:hypothetical protein